MSDEQSAQGAAPADPVRVTTTNFTSGRFGGVEFRSELDRSTGLHIGVAEVPVDKLQYFRDRRESFDFDDPEPPEKAPADMSQAELVAELARYGVTAKANTAKTALLEQLSQAKAQRPADPLE